MKSCKYFSNYRSDHATYKSRSLHPLEKLTFYFNGLLGGTPRITKSLVQIIRSNKKIYSKETKPTDQKKQTMPSPSCPPKPRGSYKGQRHSK
jgi:hypothetical protein